MIDARIVPQATMDRIVGVVRARASGAATIQALASAANISKRQVSYGLDAARTLGLVTMDPAGALALTPAGRGLAEAAHDTDEERELLRAAVKGSSAIAQIAPGLLEETPPSRSEVVSKIKAAISTLSPSTARHRAGMILAWRRQLEGPSSRTQSPTSPAAKALRGPKVEPRDQVGTVDWFEVENFKSIRKLRLEFSPLMVFVGPNGAGKTNVIQAICLFLDLLADGTTETLELYGGYEQLIRRAKRRSRWIRFALKIHLPARPRSVNPFKGKALAANGSAIAEPPPLGVEIEVCLKTDSDTDGVIVAEENLRIEQSGKAPLSAKWVKGKRTELSPGDFGALASLLEGVPGVGREPDPTSVQSRWILRTLRPFPQAIRLRLDASILRSDTHLTASRHGRLLGLAGDGLPLAVERLRRIPAVWKRIQSGLQDVYPRIESVETVHLLPGQVALKFKEKGIEEGLGQGNISDGVIHALALLVALEGSPQWSTLAIEEPENALHPWALKKLIARAEARRFNGSLLFTTHSPTVIDSIQDPACLFIVENDLEGGTKITPASQKAEALTSILAESGEKLGQLWLGGLLGGIPQADGFDGSEG